MLPLRVAGARCIVLDVAGARGAGIGQAGIEIAEDPQRDPKLRGVRHALGGESGNAAPQIGIESPRRLGLAAELGVELDQGGAVVVDEKLQGDAQFAAVAENSLMVTGKPCRTGIEVEVPMGLPVDLLRGLRFDDAVAATHGPDPSAGPRARFEDLALIAGFAETVCRRQAGNAGAQDHDALALAGSGRQLRRRGVRRRRGQQAHQVQGRIGCGCPGDAPAPTRQEPAAKCQWPWRKIVAQPIPRRQGRPAQALPLGDDLCLRRPPAHESISRRSKTQTQATTEDAPWMSA